MAIGTGNISRDTLMRETDARFFAQVKRTPGQKLDPNNPRDAAYIPVWNDIFHKVEREAREGRLVTTFDHPPVAQALQDAEVANKASAAHLDIAAASSDPVITQENILAAATAGLVSFQKADEAAALQPPTASPTLIEEAGKKAIKTPPPAHAPAEEQIAHGRAHGHAQGKHKHKREHKNKSETEPAASPPMHPMQPQMPGIRHHHHPGPGPDAAVTPTAAAAAAAPQTTPAQPTTPTVQPTDTTSKAIDTTSATAIEPSKEEESSFSTYAWVGGAVIVVGALLYAIAKQR